MSEYIPYPSFATDAPVDISFVFAEEKPAGRHGFIRQQGDGFVFADGTPARFWGTNLNGGACFPEHDYAEKLARRLAKMGLNIVRFHQMDAEWNTPNIFQFTKGPVREDSRNLDFRSLDRLDYLVYCLKREGIYVYMDLLTYRRFKAGDGIENAHLLGDAAKPCCIYNRRMIELQKQFAYDIFHHINPYTGLAYKDEPAVVMTEIVNECDLFSGTRKNKLKVEPYVSELRGLLRAWLDENGVEYDAENCDLDAMDEPIIRFKTHLHDAYYRELYQYLRQIGVKIPVTGTNWNQHCSLFRSNEQLDFTDTHGYFYDWRWGEREKFCMNMAITERDDPTLVKLCHMRSLDKPMFVSEWDMPWPNEYRAESPIFYATVGSLQGWSGFAIHTYSYCPSQEGVKILGKEMWSDAIGGVPYREGIYSTWNDPAKFGLFYHSALITRRADVAQAEKRVAVKMDPYYNTVRASKAKGAPMTEMADYNAGAFDEMAPAMLGLAEVHKVGVTLTDRGDVDLLVTEPTPVLDVSGKEVCADNGQMYRSWEKNYGWVDTDMTKCVYGFLEKNGPIALKGLTVDCKTDFAVIAMSSLGKEDLGHTNNILLTTVGRAGNTGAEFEGEKMLRWGTAPIEIEVIRAEIQLRTDRPNMKVWSVSPEGFYHGMIASTWEDGVLRFTVGEHWRSMYYLIQAE